MALDHALGTEDQRVALEVDALVTRVLEVIAEQPASAEALAVLEMWHVLCDFVRTSPAPPNVTDLWVDTLPTDDLDLTALAELQRLSVWVSLVTILDAHGSRALADLGFDDQRSGVARTLVQRGNEARATDLPPEHQDILSSTFRWAAMLFPDAAQSLRRIARRPDTMDDPPHDFESPRAARDVGPRHPLRAGAR